MKIALLGFGNVGRGAHEALSAFAAPEIEVKYVLVRRIRACGACEAITDFSSIVNDPEIGLVAEVMGGVEPARSYLLAAMRAGKHAVSANKELISLHFEELYGEAAKNAVCFRHTACAGGGIPWLHNLERAMRCDEISELGGIMNGTSNYMLHAMGQGSSYAETLKRAQALGYAEAEPGADVDGHDAARKCLISANLAFGAALDEAGMDVAGIRHADACDIGFGKARGMALKLIARAARTGDAVCAYVEPRFVSAASQEAAVPENYNLISLTGKRVGRQSFFGQGAGMAPTGASVAQDILDIARGIVKPPAAAFKKRRIDNGAAAHAYYVRTSAVCGELLALCREQLEIEGKRAYITKPIAVDAMHALMKILREEDPQLFFAGLDEA